MTRAAVAALGHTGEQTNRPRTTVMNDDDLAARAADRDPIAERTTIDLRAADAAEERAWPPTQHS
ncbi:hypothetical protein SSPS47_24840 [Streptomyces sp. S4.7]|uniref:hypothetical protein n=1 Tax=unclassified Streptomyces TaxID=2593676 RepID=UPI001396D575|nr:MULTISPECIES: hypothetical protein [unclassified Streptomyces]QHY98345.1 hypothetical protein SSPS47_24840 [Streptomyces sp. S4.7]